MDQKPVKQVIPINPFAQQLLDVWNYGSNLLSLIAPELLNQISLYPIGIIQVRETPNQDQFGECCTAAHQKIFGVISECVLCRKPSSYQINDNQYCVRCVQRYFRYREEITLANLNDRSVVDIEAYKLYCHEDELALICHNYSINNCRLCTAQYKNYPCKMNGCLNGDLQIVNHWTKTGIVVFQVCVTCREYPQPELDQSISILIKN